MTTFTVNENSKAAKAFLEFIKTLSFVQIKEENSYVAEEQSPYGKEFVEKMKLAQEDIKAGRTKEIDPNDVWGSLGLK
jgi:hypothetical protein